MIRRTPHLIALLATALVGFVGCGDQSFFERSSTRASTDEDSAAESASTRLVPEFQLSGKSELPRKLFVEDVNLRVAAIRFEPVGSQEMTVGYVTPEPMRLTFRLGEGETSERAEPIELPSSGRYEVTLRVEPADRSTDERSSVAFSGYVPVEQSSCRGSRHASNRGEERDGNPLPIPYEPQRKTTTKSASPSHWGDFSYRSVDSYRYSLGEVRLERGLQMLSFTFDVGGWAREMKRPIERAMERHDCPELDGKRTDPSDDSAEAPDRTETLSVDVSDEVDQFGEGPEQIGDHLSVQTEDTDEAAEQMIDG